MDFFAKLFDTADFPARWYCGTWTSGHGWLHIISDLAVFGAYTAIPLVIAYFILQRNDVRFPKVFWLFCGFIFACGTVHLIEASIFWQPWYRFSGMMKLITAIVSWVTVIALIKVVPGALRLPSLDSINQQLKAETERLKSTQTKLSATLEELRSANLQTSAIIESIGDGIVVADNLGNSIFVNAAAKKILGDEVAESPAHQWTGVYDIFLADGKTHCPLEQRPLYQAINGKHVENEERLFVHRNKSIPPFWIRVRATPVVDQNHASVGGVVTFHDITRKKQDDLLLAARHQETKSELSSAQEEFDLVIDSIPDAVWSGRREGNKIAYRYCSPVMEEICGMPPAYFIEQPSRWLDVVHPDDRQQRINRIQQAISGETKVLVDDYRIIHKDGSVRWIRNRIKVKNHSGEIRVNGVISDITNEKLTQEALVRAERLASIGVLAAGIAHEINNPLGAMLLTSERAIRQLENSDETSAAVESIDKIIGQIKRCSKIANNVLRFAKHEETEKHRQNVGTILKMAIDLVRRRAMDKNIDISIECRSDNSDALVNQTEMEQVFINVLSNAIDASDPGSVIRTAIESNPDGVVISISDDGVGMDGLTKERIFDPFFTSKREQGGTGLGLSITHGIMEDHGGTIRIESLPGRGTTLFIMLPERKPLTIESN